MEWESASGFSSCFCLPELSGLSFHRGRFTYRVLTIRGGGVINLIKHVRQWEAINARIALRRCLTFLGIPDYCLWGIPWTLPCRSNPELQLTLLQIVESDAWFGNVRGQVWPTWSARRVRFRTGDSRELRRRLRTSLPLPFIKSLFL